MKKYLNISLIYAIVIIFGSGIVGTVVYLLM